MKIKWYGHSAWGITAGDGTRIITDPYQSGAFGGSIKYTPIKDPADVVLISHEHADHNYAYGIGGKAKVVHGAGSYKFNQYSFTGLATYHDDSGGSQRGKNTIFTFEVEGIKLAHFGDLGQYPAKDIIDKLAGVEVVFIPIGGHFTIDSSTAVKIVKELAPRVVFPMHYKTELVDFPITPVEDFTKLFGKEQVKSFNECDLELTKGNLPQATEVWVLEYSK